MEYWIVFKRSDGTELYRGMLSDAGSAAQQQIPADADFLVVPAAAVATFPTDLTVISEHLRSVIDEQAEQARMSLLTPGTGQALVYLAKQREAEALRTNPQAEAPILRAEAAALGVDVAELAAQVLFAAAAAAAQLGVIEGLRRAAKASVAAATNLAAMKAAAAVAWPST